MKSLCLLLPVALLACSSSAPPSVFNTWYYSAPGSATGYGLTLNRDYTYVASTFAVTSSASGNAQVEKGTYSATATALTFTPTEWSCEQPTDPPYTVQWKEVGNSFEVAYPSGIIVYQVDTAGVSSVAITYGCFDTNGNFFVSPLTPVGSCAAAGTSCSSSQVCCEGAVCINAGICAGVCTQNSDCMSGCCTALSSVSCSQSPFGTCGYCAPPTACGIDAG